jgi:hypothetical protein
LEEGKLEFRAIYLLWWGQTMKFKLFVVCALVGLPIFLSKTSYAANSDFAQLLAKYQKEDPVNGLAKFKADYERTLQVNSKSPSVQNAQAKIAKEALKAPKTKDTNDGTARKDDAATSHDPSVTFLVRQSFSDIWLFDDPNKVSEVKGATASWSQDNIAHDTTWSIHGMGAAVVSVPGAFGNNSVLGANLASYVQVDREIHSKLTKKNADTIVGGGTSEVGIDAFGGSQYLRLSAAALTDRIADQTSVTTMFEWLPVYGGDNCIGSPCAVPGLPIIYRFQPELKVQYDHTTDAGALLTFSGRKEALRIGPEFTFLFKPFGPQLAFLSQLHGQITYHPWIEVYSDTRQSWLDASLTYDIDHAGHLGLTGSYTRGSTEQTGVLTNIYKIALTGKL